MKGLEPEASVESRFLDAEDDVEPLGRGGVAAPVVEELPEAEVLDGLQFEVIVQLVRHLAAASGLKLAFSRLSNDQLMSCNGIG